jgi:hypothetical protein
MAFNEDGAIQKVIPTLRGVGIVDAKSKIQIDRYSAISKEGVTVSFLDATNTFAGWKISLHGKNTWIQFDRVEFGKNELKSVNVRSVSSTGGFIEIRLDQADGPLLARVEIGKDAEWKVINARLQSVPAGVHNLFVIQDENNNIDLDWISFE